MTGPTATQSHERIEVLDALRGFALFGILLANIRDWSAWSWLSFEEQSQMVAPAVVRVLEFLNYAMIESKFYTLFSFLFGLGFSLQLTRLRQKGLGVSLFRRRLWLLFAIGLVHLCLVWTGDILTLYALLGFLLPWIGQWSDRRLLWLSAGLLLLPVAGICVVTLAGVPPDFGFYALGEPLGGKLWSAFGAGPLVPENEWLLQDQWSAYWAWTLAGPPFRVGYFFESWRIPKVLGIMVLGVWAGKRLVAGTLLNDRKWLKRVMWAGLAVGLPMNAIYAWLGGLQQETARLSILAMSVHSLGVVPLALAYASGFALLWQRCERQLKWLGYAGRMALTHYLSHSLIGAAIFYGVGLGLMGQVPITKLLVLAIAIFAAQTAFSYVWLARFKQGPMEWLWRLGTYRSLKR